jgi:hypothetical protein
MMVLSQKGPFVSIECTDTNLVGGYGLLSQSMSLD